MLCSSLWSCSVASEAQNDERIVESCSRALHLLARADGDAHAAVAARVTGSVADQHAGRSHEANELGMLCANLDEDKIRAAGPTAHVCGIERCFKLTACGEYFAHVPLEI